VGLEQEEFLTVLRAAEETDTTQENIQDWLQLDDGFLVLFVDTRVTVRLEELGQLKNTVASSGIEPATFRLAA
jgi:hypothetical protein